ncbi:MAG TPA: protoporphyrinogen oxidase [Candidatus Limnocylindrales bacterium]|nr:protoporphyrinogen oxidase [Candidatus Limnocylindrales bacterium]
MTVLVVGGGITGLASAYELGRAGIPTLLVEDSKRLGGKIRTEVAEGFVIEHGPDSFVSYRPAGIQLCRELGLEEAIIRPREPRSVFVRAGGRFRRFPDGMGLVLPTKFLPFVTSDLFSPLAKARMGLDLLLSRSRDDGDVAVGPFLRRRLGASLVDRLAGPLIGGVYGTPIDELSLDAVVPQLRAHEREHRSLLLAALGDGRARRRAAAARVRDGAPSAPPSPFVSLAGGTGQLVDALVEAVRALPSVGIWTGALVEDLSVEGTQIRVRLCGGERLAPEAVILATPAPVTADLLARDVPEAAAHLRAIPHGDTAVVNLAYGEDQLPDDLAGHGFLVAGGESLTISAATLSSNKWAGRAPEGTLLVRAFIGDGRADRAADGSALIAAAHRDVAGTLGIRGRPIFTRVARYLQAMPHYTVGHLDRVAAAEAALAAHPALRIAGGAYRGVGLPDCIAQGRSAAGEVAARLSGGLSSTAGRTEGIGTPPAASIPGSATTESIPVMLDALPVGRAARIVSVAGEHGPELALEGVLPGTSVSIASRAPLGGPVVIGVGRARVAVARKVAARIAVQPLADAGVEAAP